MLSVRIVSYVLLFAIPDFTPTGLNDEWRGMREGDRERLHVADKRHVLSAAFESRTVASSDLCPSVVRRTPST